MNTAKTIAYAGFLAAIITVVFTVAALADSAHEHRHQTLPPAAGELSGNSLYQLESAWLNQDGEVKPLRALAGRPVVAAMIYTSCEFACPLIVRDMLAIQTALDDHPRHPRSPHHRHPRSLLSGGGDGDGDGDDGGDDGGAGDGDGDSDGDSDGGDDGAGNPPAQFVLFSFDPARDTPAAMRDYAANKQLPAPHWQLLAADDDATLELAVALGVRFQPIAGGDFAHSNIIFVLDCAGEIAHRQEGLGIPPTKAVAAIQTATKNCGG